MNAAFGDARNAASQPISSGRPKRLVPRGASMRDYGFVPAAGMLTHQPLYVAGEPVGLDQSGIDCVDPHPVANAKVGHGLGEIQQRDIDGAANREFRRAEREPTPTMLMTTPCVWRRYGQAARVMRTQP